MVKGIAALTLSLAVSSFAADAAAWPRAVAPAVPEADGYVAIPDAAVPPSKQHIYKAVFDSTQAADDPKAIFRR